MPLSVEAEILDQDIIEPLNVSYSIIVNHLVFQFMNMCYKLCPLSKVRHTSNLPQTSV